MPWLRRTWHILQLRFSIFATGCADLSLLPSNTKIRLQIWILLVIHWYQRNIAHQGLWLLSLRTTTPTHLPTPPRTTPLTKRPLFRRRYFQMHFRDERICILIKNSLKSVPKCPTDYSKLLVKIIAWCRICDEPLSKPMPTRFTDAYKRH